MEGLVTFKRENRYDPETYEIAVPKDPAQHNGPEVRIGVFDKVTVEITVEKVRLSFGVLQRRSHTDAWSTDHSQLPPGQAFSKRPG